jgi:uncharacterized membrane protein YfcA
MEIAVISIVAFLTAILTFFSGFGLGTLLTPVFMLFFPVDIAIGLCGIVHFFNGLFKFILVGKKANREVVLKFGIPAIIAAIVGSWLLLQISDLAPLFSYSLFGKQFEVYPVKFIIAVLLIVFALLDLIPFLNKLEFGKDKLPLGGILSGFFGGLSGHQGALRSAFLIKAGLSKESFIATGIVVSLFIDFTRLSVYASKITSYTLYDNKYLLLSATLCAFAGAYLSNQLLKKVTLKFLQAFVAVLLLLVAVGLGMGVL